MDELVAHFSPKNLAIMRPVADHVKVPQLCDRVKQSASDRATQSSLSVTDK
jgi:hypothetical protein